MLAEWRQSRKEYNLDIMEQIIGTTNWTLASWERSLEQLDYDADIAFFGDSITLGGDFQSYFSNKKIINLGKSGDSLIGMEKRVKMLNFIKPEKVFIMGGINSLTDTNSDTAFQYYADMLDAIQVEVPDAQLYIESILPISEEKEKICADNSVIFEFNNRLKALADEKNMVYVDLHSLYVLNGFISRIYNRWYTSSIKCLRALVPCNRRLYK